MMNNECPTRGMVLGMNILNNECPTRGMGLGMNMMNNECPTRIWCWACIWWIIKVLLGYGAKYEYTK